MNDKATIRALQARCRKLEKTVKALDSYFRSDIRQQYMDMPEGSEYESRSMTFKQYADGTYTKDLDGN